jgi:hypothetical protein
MSDLMSHGYAWPHMTSKVPTKTANRHKAEQSLGGIEARVCDID